MQPLAISICQAATIGSLTGVLFLAGCTTTLSSESVQISTNAEWRHVPVSASNESDNAAVVRYGRYTLIELVPEPAQRDLLQQVVEVSTPQQFDTHVGDAMRHVLRRSGYRLCETEEAASLNALPLPAAHLRLGPLTLRDALLVLAGPAWELAVDDAARQVCFARNGALLTIGSAPVSHAEGEQPQEAQP